jgi:hypothetical protein
MQSAKSSLNKTRILVLHRRGDRARISGGAENLTYAHTVPGHHAGLTSREDGDSPQSRECLNKSVQLEENATVLSRAASVAPELPAAVTLIRRL